MVTSLPLEAIAHILLVFSIHTCFVVGDETKICFWEDFWWGNQSLCLQFPRLNRVTITKKLSISAILGNDTSSSWDLIFRRNLTNVEIEDLKKLMSLLSHVHLTPFILDAKTWVPSSSRGFSIKSFLLVLSISQILLLFTLLIFYGNQEPPLRL